MPTFVLRLLLLGALLCTRVPAKNSLNAQTDVPFSYPEDYISNFADVYVADDGSGLLGGTCGVLRASTDGGLTWANVSSPTANDIVSIACPPPGCATALLATDAALYRLANGSWNEVTPEGLRRGSQLDWLSQDLVVNGGTANGLWRSTDAGLTWTFVHYGGNSDANLFFADVNNGFVFIRNELFTTTDGGATFFSTGYTHPGFIEYHTWLDANTGWLWDEDRK
ncbi:MAG: hypothetical protein AAF597_04025, partial [Bacteroidota bacterium]